MKTPLISLIIPTHRRALLLNRALSSINRQSSRELIEVVVVSDVIDEDTNNVAHQMLNSHDIFLRRNGLAGPAQSRNAGLDLSTGKFIMFLDDDDTWHPDFITNLIKNISFMSSSLCYFDCIVIKESRPPQGPIYVNERYIKNEGKLDISIFVKNRVHLSCYIINRSIIKDLKFDIYMRAYEDWEFQLSLYQRSISSYLPIVSSIVHEVDDNTSDRRGSSIVAKDYNAVLDYLYVYRRNTSPTDDIRKQRFALLNSSGLNLDPALI